MQDRKYCQECPWSVSNLPVFVSCPFHFLFFTTRWRSSFYKLFLNMFQGSEEKTVVYVVGNPGRQHWQHVYTAVTRGRCRVYVIAEESHLRRAVTNKSIPRKTRLQRFLREEIAETSTCPEQISSTLTKDAPDPSEPGTDLVKEGSADLRKEQMGDSQQKISPYKRQRNHAENPEDAMKTSSVSISLLFKV